jgi:hypothetical protein
MVATRSRQTQTSGLRANKLNPKLQRGLFVSRGRAIGSLKRQRRKTGYQRCEHPAPLAAVMPNSPDTSTQAESVSISFKVADRRAAHIRGQISSSDKLLPLVNQVPGLPKYYGRNLDALWGCRTGYVQPR